MKLLIRCLLLLFILNKVGFGQVAYFSEEYVVTKGTKLVFVWDRTASQTIPPTPMTYIPGQNVIPLISTSLPAEELQGTLLYFRVRSAPKVSGPFDVKATIYPVTANLYDESHWKWEFTADTYREIFVTAWYEVTEGTTKKIVESPGSNHVKMKVKWP